MITLGVDQATQCGWSIHRGTVPVCSGTLNKWDWKARREVLQRAYELANEHQASTFGKTVLWGEPEWFVFAYEDHSKAPLQSYKSTAQVLSLGGSLDLWLDSLNRMKHPQARRLGISVRGWRAQVLGLKSVQKSPECKSQAVRWAEDHTGKRDMTDDEAEACAVSMWGATAGIETNAMSK